MSLSELKVAAARRGTAEEETCTGNRKVSGEGEGTGVRRGYTCGHPHKEWVIELVDAWVGMGGWREGARGWWGGGGEERTDEACASRSCGLVCAPPPSLG